MNRTSVVVALCLALPVPLGAQDVDEKTAEKTCARFASWKPGPEARPTEEDRRLVASGSLRPILLLQWGEEPTEEREYDETRRYCLVKGDCDIALAMIFANGWGVARDYDAATWFLCRVDRELTRWEKESMLAHVERMRTAEEPEDLRYCDHATDPMGVMACPQPSTGEESPEDRIARVRETLRPEAARRLNESYRRVMASPWEKWLSDADEEGRTFLRDAQRAWIRYRDAWVAFYQARWKGTAKPEALKREISCALTTERSVQLAGINTD